MSNEKVRALTPAFEASHFSRPGLQRLIHWHESYAQALGPKAMHDGQARAEQLEHQQWVRQLIVAMLRAGQREPVGNDRRTAADDRRSTVDVEVRGKSAWPFFGTLGAILVSAIVWHIRRH
jgi:hypothetical protein